MNHLPIETELAARNISFHWERSTPYLCRMVVSASPATVCVCEWRLNPSSRKDHSKMGWMMGWNLHHHHSNPATKHSWSLGPRLDGQSLKRPSVCTKKDQSSAPSKSIKYPLVIWHRFLKIIYSESRRAMFNSEMLVYQRVISSSFNQSPPASPEGSCPGTHSPTAWPGPTLETPGWVPVSSPT